MFLNKSKFALYIFYSGKSTKPFRITKSGEGVCEFNQTLNQNNQNSQINNGDQQIENLNDELNQENLDFD